MQAPLHLMIQQKLADGIRRAKRPEIERASPGSHWTNRYPGYRSHEPHQPLMQPEFPMLSASKQEHKSREEFFQEFLRAEAVLKGHPVRGNMLLSDYRFFVGAREEISMFSRCRACRTPVYGGPGARRAHIERKKCTIWIVEAMKLLNVHKDVRNSSPFVFKNCVVCGDRVFGLGRWGVPMCGKLGCRDTWMFGNEPLPAWIQALAVAWTWMKTPVEKCREDFLKETTRR